MLANAWHGQVPKNRRNAIGPPEGAGGPMVKDDASATTGRGRGTVHGFSVGENRAVSSRVASQRTSPESRAGNRWVADELPGSIADHAAIA